VPQRTDAVAAEQRHGLAQRRQATRTHPSAPFP
jgi:hypothetical protein